MRKWLASFDENRPYITIPLGGPWALYFNVPNWILKLTGWVDPPKPPQPWPRQAEYDQLLSEINKAKQ